MQNPKIRCQNKNKRTIQTHVTSKETQIKYKSALAFQQKPSLTLRTAKRDEKCKFNHHLAGLSFHRYKSPKYSQVWQI